MLTLSWLIPACPCLAFGLIGLRVHRHRTLSQALAILAQLCALVLSQLLLWTTVRAPAVRQATLLRLFTLGTEPISLGFYVDPTSAALLATVSFVGLAVTLYSVGTMHADRCSPRFFAYLSLLVGATLGAILCDSLLTFFVFQAIVGTCSFLLIGFRWERSAAAGAALKAFLVSRIGDLCLLLALLLLYAEAGSLAYTNLFSSETLAALASVPALGSLSVATVTSLLLFGGAIGKSAQLPLHVWLPDAVEALMPATALIYTVTQTLGGVYLLIRTFPLLRVSEALPVIAVVGALTALYGAVIALVQHDIKRLLAFSTISQLGCMVAAVGMGAYAAGLLHLIIYAFAMALLLLAAGSLIQGIKHGHRHTPDHALPADALELPYSPNDIRYMGGLAFRMPLTALAFLVGSMALGGLSLVTSGFWSGELLIKAWAVGREAGALPTSASYTVTIWGLRIVAGLTGFRVARQLSLVFLGAPRTRAAVYARESSAITTIPMGALTLFVVTLGWLALPRALPFVGRWLPDRFALFIESTTQPVPDFAPGLPAGTQAWHPMLVGIAASLGGLFLGWWVYGRRPLSGEPQDVDPVERVMRRWRLGAPWRFAAGPVLLDAVYRAWVAAPVTRSADALDAFDRHAIDAPLMAFGHGLALAPFRAIGEGEELPRRRSALARVAYAPGFLITRAALWLETRVLEGLVGAIGDAARLLSSLASLLDTHLAQCVVRAVSAGVRALSALVGLFGTH
jgi:NADH-quinone oxidoreductase subunit L